MSVIHFGRYELLRKIAAGGMAEIFLARQRGEAGFFRDVVIKRLFRHLAEHEKALTMFQYEARLLAELNHPNIPQVYELGCIDGVWFLAMELIDGSTVADLWRAGARAGHRMPLPVAAGIALQACEALHHAHECRDRAGRPLKIVHRDVTPHNSMMSRDGVVKLMDFGVAQTAARRDTEAGAVRGTFSYMAPEQVRARPLDKRADVFAMGVILYELSTGTRLFRGSDVQVMTAIVEHDAPAPSLRVPDYPPDLEEIVMAALQRDRSQRLPSAAHLAYALEDFAVRNGVLIGPRAIAQHYRAVFPYEREPEEELALVPDDSTEPEEEGGGWGVDIGVDLGVIDESGIMRDLELLIPESEGMMGEDALERLAFAEVSQHKAGGPYPEPLAGFDEVHDEVPPVLLESPREERKEQKDQEAEQELGDHDFVDDLARRLESDDS